MFLKPQADKDGYLYVNLYKDGKYKSLKIHRLVAEAYLPNPDNLPQVGHRDESRNNNSLTNLYWTTALDNNNYGSHNEKLSNSHKKAIYCIELDRIFESGKQAAEELKLNKGNISSCLNGKRKTVGGYHWQYVN